MLSATYKFVPTLFADPGPAPQRIIIFWASDIPTILISAFILLSIRRFLTKKIFEWYGRSKGLKGIKLLRFSENAWFSSYYTLQVMVGFYVLWRANWLWNPSGIYLNYPEEHVKDFDREELSGLRFYYLVACGFYTQALYGLLFIDEKMKDFSEMVIHHIITISLIAFSITTSFHRVGSLIILLHDFVDVFLYWAKLTNEIGKELLANVLFTIFTLSFFILRLVCLPYIILLVYFLLDDPVQVAAYPQSHYIFKFVTDAYSPFEVSSYGVCLFQYCVSTLYAALGALTLLVCLHIYWFTIIVKLAYKTITGTHLHDPRLEEKSVESSEETTTSTKKIESVEAAHPPSTASTAVP